MSFLSRLVSNSYRLTAYGLRRAAASLRRQRRVFTRVRLHGPLNWVTVPQQRFGARAHQPSLEELGELLRDLATVPSLDGVVFEIDGVSASLDRAIEAARMIRGLKGAGKKTIAVMVGRGTREYVIASACDRVLLSPGSGLSLLGVGVESNYYRDLLDKVGVKVEVYRAGKFKSAMEPFIANEPSEEAQMAVGAVLDTAYAATVDAIAAHRHVTGEVAKGWVDGGPYTRDEAIEAKLVDGVAHPDLLAETLAPPDNGAKFAQAARVRGLARRAPPMVPLRGRASAVAVLHLSGMIVQNASDMGPFGRNVITWAQTRKLLRALKKDEAIGALVVWIDSGGGDALASELIYGQLRDLDLKKPVVAYMDRVAASGGYFIAAGARQIWAAPNTVTGSIGVFRPRPVASGLYEKLGVHTHGMSRGAGGGMRSVHALDERDAARVQAEVDAIYGQFLACVAESRKMTVEAVDAVAQGRIFSGRDAKVVGLVDALGTFDEAAREAARLGGVGLVGGEVPLAMVTPRMPFLSRVMGVFGQADAARVAVEALGVDAEVAALPWLLRRNATLALWRGFDVVGDGGE